jgi:hypothetical protein
MTAWGSGRRWRAWVVSARGEIGKMRVVVDGLSLAKSLHAKLAKEPRRRW